MSLTDSRYVNRPAPVSVRALPCFADNYIWLIDTTVGRWLVDPGDAAPALAALAASEQPLRGVLVTHHHADHIAGIPALVASHPAPVLGPAEAGASITQVLTGGESLTLPGLGRVEVLAVGAHTLGHIAYYLPDAGLLFCGDTLFSAGCGRLFEGTPDDLLRALTRINALPAETRIFPTHEYTAANLRFAVAVEPENSELRAYQDQVRAWRAENRPSLPTSLALERQVNPFLRVGIPAVVSAARHHAGTEISTERDTLAALRAWKDHFLG